MIGSGPHQTPQHTAHGFSLNIKNTSCHVHMTFTLATTCLQEREIRRQRVAQQREVDNQRRAQERTMRLLAHLRQQEIDRDRR